MKYLIPFVICFLVVSCSSKPKKQLAITFDDSPRHARGLYDGPTRAKKLIKVLKDNDVQACNDEFEDILIQLEKKLTHLS